jgi:hypothetical protein
LQAGPSRAGHGDPAVASGRAAEIVSGVRVGFSLTLLDVLIGEMFASHAAWAFC